MAEKLNAKNLGLAGGTLWGVTIFATTLVSLGTGLGNQFLLTYGSLHPGYSISVVGSVVGLAYGFICGFVGLYVLAWLYNWFERTRR
ncbi:MAG: hypothetical protein HY832_02660 [Candidatus Aenigmarchaeota archaeon]|nr:hypothetical protein [Candidatus Aenigmarchaeota archaeon]